jgi:two-component system response regulator VanR
MEFKTYSVLLVEDDESVRHLVATFLRRYCSSVDTASDGEEAIELVRKNRYDTVVLDIMLPKANGFQVAHAIRALEHPPRIVVLSAVAGHFEDRFPADTILIQKPFDFTALIDAVVGPPD